MLSVKRRGRARHDHVVGASRETIRGAHRGELFGISPTNKHVAIDVIDIVRVKDGRYVEHWGVNTLASVLALLKAT